MAAWHEFLTASHLLERRIEEQLKESSGLTHSQYEIMVQLADAPDRRMRMTELARKVVVTKSGLTYQVGQLEKRGFVERRPCASDDRGILAVLTDPGMTCLRSVAPGHVDVVRESLIDRLDPEELDAMARAMSKVRRGLRPGAADGEAIA
jgi:DNA-binding MarR family transcriptional regulator